MRLWYSGDAYDGVTVLITTIFNWKHGQCTESRLILFLKTALCAKIAEWYGGLQPGASKTSTGGGSSQPTPCAKNAASHKTTLWNVTWTTRIHLEQTQGKGVSSTADPKSLLHAAKSHCYSYPHVHPITFSGNNQPCHGHFDAYSDRFMRIQFTDEGFTLIKAGHKRKTQGSIIRSGLPPMNADGIRVWMGDFSDTNIVAKHVAHMIN
ncbi:hypothetical protein BC941DRAFT_466167 [Chlamydoabsidia padenii]|nr:hypothetical protein BC941DRAFT_466167 [Chlamydoabsidia padenii]